MNWRFKYAGIFLFILVSCSQKFDSNKWKEQNDPTDKTRYYMAEDLVGSKILVGKSKGQVEMLLGDASNIMDNDSLNMYYSVWDDYLLDIDPVKSYGLHIKFNEKGQVESAEVQKWK